MTLKYKHTLLLVDDEESITKSLKRLFRNEGYEIHTASSGQEGLDLIKEIGKPFSLIISDQRMPGMTGAEFLEQAKKILPKAIRILLTGYSDMDAIVDAINKGEIYRYLTKPWNDNDMLLQVRQSLMQYELKVENRRLLTLIKNQNLELRELNKNLEKKVEERSFEIIEKNEKLSRLSQQFELDLYNAVRAFASLAETHTPILMEHGRRVSIMSREIAQNLGLDEKEILHTEIAALLHDIGKVGFPSKVLEYRENDWTSKDKDMFRKHPEKGQATVQFIDNLDYVGLSIRCHHEQYDGQGYPDKIAEQEIPLGARIIAVTNAYDKIVNLKINVDKSYKEVQKVSQMTQDHLAEDEVLQKAAILHLRENGFTQYDPDIVKIFLDLLKKKGISYGRENEVSIGELEKDMVLSRSLYSSSGRFIIPHQTILTEIHINKLQIFHKLDPITDIIYVVAK